jgi:hypothetical protein
MKIYKAAVLPVVLYVCEIWCATQKEDYKYGVF